MYSYVEEYLLDSLVNWHVESEGFSAHGASPEPASENVIHGYLTIPGKGRHDPRSQNYVQPIVDYSSDYVRTEFSHPMYSEPEIQYLFWRDHDQWYGP